jgi:hypothetical protein
VAASLPIQVIVPSVAAPRTKKQNQYQRRAKNLLKSVARFNARPNLAFRMSAAGKR